MLYLPGGLIDLRAGTSVLPHTAHTTNPVPLLLVGGRNCALNTESLHADIAPPLLEQMELPKPKKMTGTSLLKAD